MRHGRFERYMNILHIAAHMGGGVGKAISGISLRGQRQFGDAHRVLLLQPPEKDGYVQVCRDGGVDVLLWDGGYGQLAWADVIVVSWWDHPSMARFLRDFPSCAAGLVLWCHVNGCCYPCLPFPLARAFDRVLFTSPYSLNNPNWTAAEREMLSEQAAVVYGMGDFEPAGFSVRSWERAPKEFCIGYVGTLNYGKIHPAFVSYCGAVYSRVPAARFIMVGDRDRQLEHDVRKAGLADRFSFPGFVPDAPALMRTFDVFGYLLNPEHYGTTENVLLESMACGVPPVVLRQNVEQYIVPDKVDFLVSTPEEYGKRLEALWKNPAVLEEMGRQAREHVLRQYNCAENTARFRSACVQVMGRQNGLRDFSVMGDTPWQWFCFCLDSANRERFRRALEAIRRMGKKGAAEAVQLLRGCPPILRERRKSSLRHFAAVYPGDPSLQMLCEQMEE